MTLEKLMKMKRDVDIKRTCYNEITLEGVDLVGTCGDHGILCIECFAKLAKIIGGNDENE